MAFVQEQAWIDFLSAYPDAHLLQTPEWGRFKQNYGWYSRFLVTGQTGAMVLFRRLPLKRTIAYVPKGPIGPDWKTLLEELTALCKQERAILLYIEPDAWEACAPYAELADAGFSASTISIQPRQTIIIPLEGTQDDWLGRMKQKTRYNIRLAEKKGVVVEKSSDLDAFTELMRVTGTRDEFGIHQASYYQKVYEIFSRENSCVILMASYEGNPLAAIMVFRRGNRAWYFYGASNNQERNRMPTYLLQWEGMKWAASMGVKQYDLWGIPDGPEDALENQFTTRSDGLWGVYRFKRGFGGEVKRSAGVYQKILNQPLYALYQIVLKFKKSMVS